MELSRVNHVITAIIGMLTDLVDQGVRACPERRFIASFGSACYP